MIRFPRPALFLAATISLLAASTTAPRAVRAQAAAAAPPASAGAFLRWPDIHGDRVVFSSEGDLWLGSISTGQAQRLTSHPGSEVRPHFSPDGNQIAFTAQYDSDSDVYVMPTAGGAPVRLTYEANSGGVVGWSPDGRDVLFLSKRDSVRELVRLFRVPAAGGRPASLPIPEVQQASMNADGRRVAYVPISADWQHWYRYKGGMADHLWLTDTSAKTFRRLTDFDGIDKDPVWVGDTLYFISQRDGVPNLYKMAGAGGRAAAVTHYRVTAYPTAGGAEALYTDEEIDHLSTDGKRLIFEHGNGLGLYDPSTNKTTELRFTLASDRIHARPRRVPLASAVEDIALGPSARRLVVSARGQLVSVPVKEGDARLLAPKPGSRSHSPVWSPDGKRVAFVSDRSGEEQVWVASTALLTPEPPRQLTKDHKGPLGRLEWSPDGKWLAVGDREMRLLLIDAQTGATTLVDQADRGGTYHSGADDFHFSPDGKWLTYAKQEPNWYSAVYLYDIANRKSVRLTDPEQNAWAPAFDTAGKYLVWLADRQFNPEGSGPTRFFAFRRTARVSMVTLAKETKSPYLVTNDEEGRGSSAGADAAKKSDDSAKPDAKQNSKPDAKQDAKPAAGDAPKLPDVKVDLDGLAERLVEVPIPSGEYRKVAMAGDRLFVLDNENPFAADAGNPGATLLVCRVRKAEPGDDDANRLKVLAGPVGDAELTPDGKTLLMLTGGSRIVVAPADGDAAAIAKAGSVSMNGLTIEVDPATEWRQIFDESWRIARDFFYDPGLHGVDWPAVRAKYARLLPAVGSRSDLNILLGQMISELNTGHAYVGGGDNGGPSAGPQPPMGFLGARLTAVAASGPGTVDAYRVERVFPGDGFDLGTRSPLLEPGVNVHAGDYVLSVAGQPVKANQDVQALFVGTAGQIVTLTVNDKPTLTGARRVQVRPISSGTQGRLHYYAWVNDRRAYVAKYGGPNLGYLHIPDMGGGGLAEFAKHYYGSLPKDGLIYDVRYNGGGYIDAMLLLQMSSKPYSYFQPRYGAAWTRQDWAFAGHSVALCNENSCSDAEEFSDAFQRLKLGPLIGARSWGGEVGSGGGYPLIDGGKLYIPNYGEWTPDGKWVIEGKGAVPDIEVEQDPAQVLAGRDPQLDRAIAYLKQQIAKNPVPRPVHPPYPNKAYAGLPTKAPKDAAAARPAAVPAKPGTAAGKSDKGGG